MAELISKGREASAQEQPPSRVRPALEVLIAEGISVPNLEEHLLFERFMSWWNEHRGAEKSQAEPGPLFTFFKLWDAFAQDECPICYLCRKARDLFLSNFWYESVNDVALRNHLHKSLGFSSDAADVSIAIGDDLGASIVYRSLCTDVADRLQNFRVAVPSQPCPAAAHVAMMNRNYVQALATHYAARNVQELHEKSFGLCLQHIRETLDILASPELRRTFFAIEEIKFRRLAEDLNTFIGKCDYRNKQPFGPEREAWIKALRKFNRHEQSDF